MIIWTKPENKIILLKDRMYQFSEVDPETKQAFKVDLLWKWLPAFSYQLFL